jgi:hypothetical protein
MLCIIMNLTHLELIKTELKHEDMKKTKYKDLVVINYRSQGLA